SETTNRIAPSPRSWARIASASWPGVQPRANASTHGRPRVSEDDSGRPASSCRTKLGATMPTAIGVSTLLIATSASGDRNEKLDITNVLQGPRQSGVRIARNMSSQTAPRRPPGAQNPYPQGAPRIDAPPDRVAAYHARSSSIAA